MKEIIELTNFKCDYCEKVIGHQKDFPYKQGWKYLHLIQYKDGTLSKTDPKKVICKSLNDKHFCCLKCLLSFLQNEIKGKKEKK